MSDKQGKVRSQNWEVVLYPDCKDDMEVLQRICEEYNYAAMLHDKDRVTEVQAKETGHQVGSPIKAHWHVVIVMPNATYSTSMAKRLGLPDHRVVRVRNLDGALRYLVHADDPDKYQYDVNDVQGPLARRVAALLEKVKKTEAERACEVIDYIDEMPIYSVRALSLYCAHHGLWDVYRRASSVFLRIMDEKFSHNRS